MLNEKASCETGSFVNFIGTGEDRYLEGVMELYTAPDPALNAICIHYLAAAPTELQEVKVQKALIKRFSSGTSV